MVRFWVPRRVGEGSVRPVVADVESGRREREENPETQNEGALSPAIYREQGERPRSGRRRN